MERGQCSERSACRHFGLHRSTFQYKAKEPDAWLAKLKAALRRLSRQYPEMGYPKITRLLKAEGWQVGARRIQHLRRELGLMVPPKKPRKRRQGASTGLPTTATHRNHVWTWDFVHDVTIRGGKLRMLTVLDEFTRECRCIHIDRKINAGKVRQVMARLIEENGAPEHIRSDNGSEFIESHLREWLASEGIKTLYIDPGSPWQNGYIESFHARFREECLNREQLWTLTEARVVIEDWRYKYNHVRPHRSLGYVTPIQFAGLALEASPLTVPAASARRSLDFLYNLKETITPPRLTNYAAQFG
ncbi:MAG TPA: IS3 family transposase [Oceanipulchritudo sp.]|nr:IS3 family transposase [Oceanipulchritudo sp.]